MTLHLAFPQDVDRVMYISGPMSGFADFNYPFFARTKLSLEKMGYKVLSPHEVDDGVIPSKYTDKHSYGWYLGRAIEMQLFSNCWVGLPGWTDSTGAMREFNLARDLGHELAILIDNDSPVNMGLIQLRARKLT